MKLTLTNIKKMKTNSTPLQKRVINYIVDEWSNYDDISKIQIKHRSEHYRTIWRKTGTKLNTYRATIYWKNFMINSIKGDYSNERIQSNGTHSLA